MLRNAAWMSAVTAIVIGMGGGVAREPQPDEAQKKLVEAGREQFTRVRQVFTMKHDDDRNVDRYFNAHSCAECHKLGGVGGAGPNENNVQLIDDSGFGTQGLVRISIVPADSPRATSSVAPSLKLQSTALAELKLAGPGLLTKFAQDEPLWIDLGRPAENEVWHTVGNSGVAMLHRRSTVADYSAQRRERLTSASPFHPELTVEPPPRNGKVDGSIWFDFATLEERNTPPLFGLGLIASIPQAAIDKIAEEQPDVIRGRSPRLSTGGRGRFGWKSQLATLAEFNEAACAAELGLKTEKITPKQQLTYREVSPLPHSLQWPAAPKVDMTADDLAALTAYVSSLPQPKQVLASAVKTDVVAGEAVFRMTGCGTCHVPNVAAVAGIYSDLLLHDIGTSGSVAYGGSPSMPASNRFDIVRAEEFRTPPLWGVADSAPYLHDGSAATLEAAIDKHARQAAPVTKHYREMLNDVERAQMIAFLKSLRAPQ